MSTVSQSRQPAGSFFFSLSFGPWPQSGSGLPRGNRVGSRSRQARRSACPRPRRVKSVTNRLLRMPQMVFRTVGRCGNVIFLLLLLSAAESLKTAQIWPESPSRGLVCSSSKGGHTAPYTEKRGVPFSHCTRRCSAHRRFVTKMWSRRTFFVNTLSFSAVTAAPILWSTVPHNFPKTSFCRGAVPHIFCGFDRFLTDLDFSLETPDFSFFI